LPAIPAHVLFAAGNTITRVSVKRKSGKKITNVFLSLRPNLANSRSMAPPPPALPDELAEEILLHLPPDEPSHLVRSSLVCKPWRCLLCHPNFLRRLNELHRTTPVLGFFHTGYKKRSSRWLDSVRTTLFVATTPSAFSLLIPDSRQWYALDYRHGRALFCSEVTREGQDFLIWDPITGDQRVVPVPWAPNSQLMNAAVVCAVEGCDHRDCRGGAFRLVFVFILHNVFLTFVCAYSSETGLWGNLLAVPYEPVKEKHSVLVGNSMYFLSSYRRTLEYDLAGRGLSAMNLPEEIATCKERIILMPMKEGRLGGAGVKETCLYLWSTEANDYCVASWVQSRVIELLNILPVDALTASRTAGVIGFAQEANVIFLNTVAGVFAIDLESERARKVYENWKTYEVLIPFSNFYIPGIVHSLSCDFSKQFS
jgi:hypothetical protein